MSLIAAQRCSSTSALTLFDFLAPSFTHLSKSKQNIRYLSSSHKSLAATTPDVSSYSSSPGQAPKPKAKRPLTQAQREFLNSALRVNQAGELAATLIYTTQTPPIVNSHPNLRPLMHHMYTQEVGHFHTFNHLVSKHRVRPTAMYPIWTIAASALGWGSAIMGREAAMACTEAVETVIGGHYNDQVRKLVDMMAEIENNGEEVGDELKELLQTIRRIRDEELEHLDHAVGNDAKDAKPYELLTGVIKAGCRGAIWVSQKV